MAPMLRTLKTLVAGVAVSMAAGALAGTIVVRATGPSAATFPPGKVITGDRVVLRTGDTLVLLDTRGTRTISGAGPHLLAGGRVGASPSALSALIRNTGTRQVRTGAVRGSGSLATRSPNLWFVDVAKSGNHCLPDLSQASLWRGDMTRAATLTLTRVGDGKGVPVSFAAGQAVRSWPTSELPLAPEISYRLSGPALLRPTTVRFAMIDAVAATPDAVGAQLIAGNCQQQLDLLVEAAATSPASG